MKKVSPLLIDRSLNKHIGWNVSRLRDGNSLFEIYNQAQTNNFLDMTHINDKYQIKVEPHKTLHTNKDLANYYDFNNFHRRARKRKYCNYPTDEKEG